MLAAARKHERVVQVGTQRRSTPHLIEARDQIIREGKLGKVGLVEVYCYYHMRTNANPPDTNPPDYLDWEMWTGPAPMRPYNSIVHPRGWRAFMEYGNGIMGDMCIHMFDMARWMLELGWPKRISSTGGILVNKASQGQHRRHPDGHVRFRRPGHRLAASHLGRRARPQISLGRDVLRRKGNLEGQRDGLRLHPARRGQADPPRCDLRARRVSRRQDRERPRTARGPGHPRPHERLPAGDRLARPAGRRHRGRLYLDDELHPRQPGDAARPDAHLGPARPLVGDDEANRLLARPYRPPWVHPGV